MTIGLVITGGKTKSPLVPSDGKTGAPGSVVPIFIAIGLAPKLRKDVKFTWSLVESSIKTAACAVEVTDNATV